MTRTLICALLGGVMTTAGAETVSSPDGRMIADVSLNGSQLIYSLTLDGIPVLEASPLGFTLNGTERGSGVTLGAVAEESVDETFPSRHGVHAEVANHYNGKRISVTHTASGLSYVLNVRAYDSGIAFRYELTHSGSKSVTAESTGFTLPSGTMIYSQQGRDVYENVPTTSDLRRFATGAIAGPPLVGRLPGGSAYVAITESVPGPDFGNPFLTKTSENSGRMFRVTYPLNADGSYGGSSINDLFTPWNVVIAGTDLNTLVNSDIVEGLAPAPDPALFPEGLATEWAQPGISTWDWMSRFPGGITADNAKLNSFWGSQLGWIYNTIDEGWGNWNGGNPWPEVREVTEYATPLGVKTLLWTRSADLATQAQRTAFFTNLRDNGVSGFKADFFDFNSVSPSAKERVALVESILREAAEFHLVVNLHGVSKPMGQFRTYPNVLNFEAVYGKESYPNAPTTLYYPFTRQLAGPSDYTPLGLQGNLQGDQTQAFEIASVAAFSGPLITIAERPDRVAQSPFASVIKGIPALWDETRVLTGSEISSATLMARRKGDVWYLLVMNGFTARNFEIPLSFLSEGITYQAEIVEDSSDELVHRMVTRSESVNVAAASSGGYVAKFTIPSTAGIDQLPFITHFNTGRGSSYAEGGVTLSDEPWASTLLEETLPDVMWDMASSGTTLVPSFDFTDPYEGGASLKVAGNLDAVNVLRLFNAELPVSSNSRLDVSFKRGQATASGMQVSMVFDDAPEAPVLLDAGDAADDGWTRREINLASYAGRTIRSISLQFSSASPIADYHINVGRLAIYDLPLATTAGVTDFRAEEVTFTSLDSFNATLQWTAAEGEIRYYRIYQKNPVSGARVWLGATAGNSFNLTGASRMDAEASAVFQVVAVGTNGMASDEVETEIALPEIPSLTNPLSGAIIGTTGSFQGSGNTRDKVFDDDVTTFFDAAVSDGVWAGIDLGADGASKVIALRYYPRDSWSARMVGGVFQGANQANFSDAITLFTIDQTPTEGTYALVPISVDQTFRYLRYLSPNGGWGNVAEVKFYGPGTPSAPEVNGADRSEGSAILKWSTVAGADSYKVKRSTVSGGPYEVVAENLTEPIFTDSGLSSDSLYYYVVVAVSSSDGDSGDSAEVEAVDGFVAWALGNGLPETAGFDGDADGNGIKDGLEYAVPAGLQFNPPDQAQVELSADLRNDPFLTMALFHSFDLTIWSEISSLEDVEQDGVPIGFHRVKFFDQATGDFQSRGFYRLQVSR